MSGAREAVVHCTKCKAGLKVRFESGATGLRVKCPRCGSVLAIRPRPADDAPSPMPPPRPGLRTALIGDEARPFRDFLVGELAATGFRTEVYEDGRELLERAGDARPELFVLNVYLRGMLGVEVCEAVKSNPALAGSKVILIGALFRANRYRSNPTNLYGADEYIEEIISAEELKALIGDLFPSAGAPPHQTETPLEQELDEARRLARIIVSDLVLYHGDKLSEGLRAGNVEGSLADELHEARSYYESRVPERVRRISSFFDDTLRDYLDRRARELAG